MAFEQDIFISYAHLDNRPVPPADEGWITRFHHAFQTVLAMRLGREPKIWRDPKLGGNDIFDREILDQLRRSALFLAVVTPRYLTSEWCPKEAREFCQFASENRGLSVGNHAAVFKLVKTPIENDDSLPDPIRRTLGYPFFITDEDGTPLELDAVYGDTFSQQFNRKVARIAYEVATQLKRRETIAPKNHSAVYVAECAYDRAEDRERIVTDLTLAGYTVLPDQALARDEATLEKQIRTMLTQCVASVHLVGSGYGAVPDGPSGRSTVVIQNQLAAELSRTNGLRRVISVPDGTVSAHPLHLEFLRSLNEEASAQSGADLLTGDIETVKQAVRSLLRTVERATAAPSKGAALGNRLVYLICTEKDRLETVPLVKQLKRANFDPHLPLFAGDAATVRQAHETLLRECGAVLLYYGQGDEAWRFHMEMDLRKSVAARERPIPVVHVYVAPPLTDDKRLLLALEESHVADGSEGGRDALLEPFIRALEDLHDD